MTHFRMPVKPWTTSGPCREASFTAITLKPRVKLYSSREESFPISLKCIDVTRTTHTNLDVKEENSSMIIGISFGHETCQILGQVSHNLLHQMKKLLTDHGPRLYVCQAPNAFICVSGVAPPKHQMRLYVCHQMRLYVCHQMRLYAVSPNAFAESATELASLAYLCSLRSHVF